MKFKGKLGISRVTCSDGNDYMNITITDNESHIQIVDVEVDIVEFANAITGQSYRDCEFELRGVANVGKKREQKSQKIKIPRADYTNKQWRKDMAEAAAPFEIDGWKAQIEDYNGYRSTHPEDHDDRTVLYTVSFIRFV